MAEDLEGHKGERFEDGRTFSDPDLIQPGWKLDVPTTTRAADMTQSTEPAVPRDDGVVESGAGNPPSKWSPISPRAVEGRNRAQTASEVATDGRQAGQVNPADEHDDQLPGWIMPGLTGAGGLLAGSLLLALRRRRANHHRIRRPGRTIPATDTQLTEVEKSIAVAGATTTTTVEFVETVLRRLVASLIERSQPLPTVAAVEVTHSALAIHLRKPTTAPGEPWVVSDDGLLWVVDKEVEFDLVGVDSADSPAP